MEGISEFSKARGKFFNIAVIEDAVKQVDIGAFGSKVVSYCQAHPVLTIALAIILVAVVIFCAYKYLCASTTIDKSDRIEIVNDQRDKSEKTPQFIQTQQDELAKSQKDPARKIEETEIDDSDEFFSVEESDEMDQQAEAAKKAEQTEAERAAKEAAEKAQEAKSPSKRSQKQKQITTKHGKDILLMQGLGRPVDQIQKAYPQYTLEQIQICLELKQIVNKK